MKTFTAVSETCFRFAIFIFQLISISNYANVANSPFHLFLFVHPSSISIGTFAMVDSVKYSWVIRDEILSSLSYISTRVKSLWGLTLQISRLQHFNIDTIPFSILSTHVFSPVHIVFFELMYLFWAKVWTSLTRDKLSSTYLSCHPNTGPKSCAKSHHTRHLDIPPICSIIYHSSVPKFPYFQTFSSYSSQ